MDNFTLEILELFLKGNRTILEMAKVPPEIRTASENIESLNQITETITNQIKQANALFIEAVANMKQEIDELKEKL